MRRVPPALTPVKTCKHPEHVGTCGACQRAMLERHRLQLVAAQAIGRQDRWRAA